MPELNSIDSANMNMLLNYKPISYIIASYLMDHEKKTRQHVGLTRILSYFVFHILSLT
jgi:hypothetical protein